VLSRPKARLPSYMIPTEFVVLDSFPLTPNGEIDCGALAALPRAKESAQELSTDFVMAPVQRHIAELWYKMFQVDRVALHDNFFDVGGHSMLIVRLQAVLQQEFGTNMVRAELFQRPTVADQAERILAAKGGDTAPRRAQTRVRERLHG